MKAVNKGDFIARYQSKLICDADEVLLATQDEQRVIGDEFGELGDVHDGQ